MSRGCLPRGQKAAAKTALKLYNSITRQDAGIPLLRCSQRLRGCRSLGPQGTSGYEREVTAERSSHFTVVNVTWLIANEHAAFILTV